MKESKERKRIKEALENAKQELAASRSKVEEKRADLKAWESVLATAQSDVALLESLLMEPTSTTVTTAPRKRKAKTAQPDDPPADEFVDIYCPDCKLTVKAKKVDNSLFCPKCESKIRA